MASQYAPFRRRREIERLEQGPLAKRLAAERVVLQKLTEEHHGQEIPLSCCA